MQERKIWAWQEDDESCPSNTQSKEEMKGKEHKPRSPYVLHSTRVKHRLERTVELGKHVGNINGMKARKTQIQISEAYTMA